MIASMFSLDVDLPAVMGIVNVTPDSFSDGGRYADVAAAVDHARLLFAQGAKIVDIGGESTRPGSVPLSYQAELDRVAPVVERVAAEGIPVSIDTRHPAVAAAAISAGAVVINDVSGLRDPEMVAVAARAQVPVVIMHAPHADMALTHAHRQYDEVVATVAGFLVGQAERALNAGVPQVAIDPGIGFGKQLGHNLELIDHLERLVALGYPVLVGASRKRMIGELAHVAVAAERDAGSLAVHLAAVSRGAKWVRVHAVAEHVQALAVWAALDPLCPTSRV